MSLTRRALMTAAASSAAGWALPGFAQAPTVPPGDGVAADALAPSSPSAVFIGHGGPNLFARQDRARDLQAMLPSPPSAFIALTPHRRTDVITVAGARGGRALRSFPSRFVKMAGDFEYRTPAAPQLAVRVLDLLGAARFEVSDRGHRGFDHTVWGALAHLAPAADIPVVEVGMPFVDDAAFFSLGRALGPLAADGVVLLASGQVTHNLGEGFGGPPGPGWAREFDAWCLEVMRARDVDALVDWRSKAPAAMLAHPDDGGHFRVLHVAAGFAAGSAGGWTATTSPHAGWDMHFSRRGFVLA